MPSLQKAAQGFLYRWRTILWDRQDAAVGNGLAHSGHGKERGNAGGRRAIGIGRRGAGGTGQASLLGGRGGRQLNGRPVIVCKLTDGSRVLPD